MFNWSGAHLQVKQIGLVLVQNMTNDLQQLPFISEHHHQRMNAAKEKQLLQAPVAESVRSLLKILPQRAPIEIPPLVNY